MRQLKLGSPAANSRLSNGSAAECVSNGEYIDPLAWCLKINVCSWSSRPHKVRRMAKKNLFVTKLSCNPMCEFILGSLVGKFVVVDRIIIYGNTDKKKMHRLHLDARNWEFRKECMKMVLNVVVVAPHSIIERDPKKASHLVEMRLKWLIVSQS